MEKPNKSHPKTLTSLQSHIMHSRAGVWSCGGTDSAPTPTPSSGLLIDSGTGSDSNSDYGSNMKY